MRLVLLLSVALLACFTLSSATNARQTPENGLVHVIDVVQVDGSRVPDGTIVSFGNADFRPPTNAEDVQRARERGPCAELPVTDGQVTLIPEFTNPDCPEGMRVSAVILTGPNTGIGVVLTPEIEWRHARPGEGPRRVLAWPVPPSDSGVGIPHFLEVTYTDGNLAPDGTKVLLSNASLPGSPVVCAELTVKDGYAVLIPEFTECPEGTDVVAIISTGPNTGIVASQDPPIDWNVYVTGDPLRSVTIMPIPPNPAGSSSGPITPPDTGTAGLKM
jgi:hypothetical protein